MNEFGKPALVQPKVPRARLHELVATLPPCTIGIEACSGAHHWARLCEAVARPTMRFVPIKTEEQQSRLMVHRARQGFVEQRTATLNRIRGLLSEFGVVLPLKAQVVRREAALRLEALPGWANTVIGDLLSEVHHLDERITQYDTHLRTLARQCTAAMQLMQLMGVGQTTATAIVAMVGRATEFDSGRQFAA